jgi:hypothetical protein
MSHLESIVTELRNIELKAEAGDFTGARKFFKDEITVLFNKAILAGEYYNREKELNKIKGLFADLNLALGPYEDAQKELLSLIHSRERRYFRQLEELNTRLSQSLSHYNSDKERQIFDIGIFEDFHLKSEMADVFKAEDSREELNSDSVYRINILLAYIDEYLECTESIQRKLILIERFLEEEKHAKELTKVISILTSKVKFLQFKIEFRNKHSNTPASKEVDSSNAYFPFFLQVKEHYRSLEFPDVIRYQNETQELSIDPSRSVKFRLSPFHHLGRYYNKKRQQKGLQKEVKMRNLVESKSETEKLLSILQEERKKPQFADLLLYDQTAFITVENLIYDTVTAIELEIIRENSFEQIVENMKRYLSTGQVEGPYFLKDYLGKIKEFANAKGKVHDYHGFVVFLRFLNKMIDFFKSNPDLVMGSFENTDVPLSIKRERISGMIDYLKGVYESALQELNRNLALLLTYKVMPVYMSMNECHIRADENLLFLRSSYILPNNFQKIRSEVNYWEALLNAQLNTLKTTFELELAKTAVSEQVIRNEKKLDEGVKAFESKVSEVEKKFEGDVTDFHKKVKDNEIKLVQIVAMFVSIATFVLINVKIFDNKTGVESFAIILGLAACFFAFNLFFHFVFFSPSVNPGSKKSSKTWLLVVPLIFASVSGLILLNKEGKRNSQLDELTKEVRRLDSVANQQKEALTEAIINGTPLRTPGNLKRE